MIVRPFESGVAPSCSIAAYSPYPNVQTSSPTASSRVPSRKHSVGIPSGNGAYPTARSETGCNW